MSTDVDNIWGELETEFESYTPAATPAVDTNQQVLRKMTVVDRFHRAIFSGWLFAAGMFGLTLAMLALTGASGSRTGFNPAAASILPGLLALPLLAPLLANVRKPLWRYALLGPLLAGPFVLAQPATLSLAMEVFSSGKSSTYMHLQFWNYYLEQYLSRPVWVMSAVGSIVLAWWLLRRQRALPWLEIPKISQWRVALAGTFAALPLSVILLVQPLGYYLLSDGDLAHLKQLEDREPKRSEQAWKTVFSKWRQIFPEATTLDSALRISAMPKETLQAIESETLALLKDNQYLEPYRYRSLSKLFLERISDLQRPVDVFVELLRAETRCPQYEFQPNTPRALADFLPHQKLNREQLTLLLSTLQKRHQRETDFTARMDDSELRIMSYLKPTGLEVSERLNAFGWKALVSPPQVYYYWRYRTSLREARATWKVVRNSSAEQRTAFLHNYSALNKLGKDARSVWYEAEELDQDISKNSSGDAQILLACLLYKLDHGKYPGTLDDLSGLLDFTPDSKRWKLVTNGQTLTLTARSKEFGHDPVQKEWHLQ